METSSRRGPPWQGNLQEGAEVAEDLKVRTRRRKPSLLTLGHISMSVASPLWC